MLDEFAPGKIGWCSGDGVRLCPLAGGGSLESRTDWRMGEVGGNISSAGFLRGGRTRLGELDGLSGRSMGSDRTRP